MAQNQRQSLLTYILSVSLWYNTQSWGCVSPYTSVENVWVAATIRSPILELSAMQQKYIMKRNLCRWPRGTFQLTVSPKRNRVGYERGAEGG
ncbi:hypothetical protein P154DRAFT_337112 [Amniculicola lignicola CBS 123094]|uniref:Secreted protein n=1 Tax=Amniculicola lignicola CBS 123094 TaxID=1392246 RepID=A0A6A5WW66_9PLEO|nr:hypothetical protein P154DRAFT_337112 [Amniculicola lignicola CBS 123094]